MHIYTIIHIQFYLHIYKYIYIGRRKNQRTENQKF